MDQDEVLEILTRVGAFRAGHFVLTSGLHSDSYILKDAMYAYTTETSALCKEMARRFIDKNVEAVIGPAVGAAILSQWTAHNMSELSGREVLAVYADKDGQGGFIIKRGYDKLIAGKRTLVVEDLTTTGGSIKKVVEAARASGAEIIGAVVICNRGDVEAADVGNPPIFEELVNVHLDTYPADACELCQKGIPINTDIGHGTAFLAEKAA